MSITTLINRLRRTLHAFRTAQGGNVLITFTLLLVPVIGTVGAAVDYSRASSARVAMQGAVDATALMLSKEAATLTPDQVTTKGAAYFNAIFNRTEVTGIQLTPVYTTSGGSQIVMTATGTVPTTFMRVMGTTMVNISAESTVSWGNTRLRIALVLDNTGSMSSSNKMTALKTAAKSLLTQLQNAAAQNGDVYVSIIPFAKDVNADPVNYSQSWVRWDLWDAANGTCSDDDYTKSSSCLSHGKTWTPRNHNTWTGCVTDRDQNYDTTNTAPSAGTPATLMPAEQYSGTCPTPLMALSYDWAALNSKINAMSPNGGTNQAIGLQWGFQSLTGAPFSIPPMVANYNYLRVIILLTDGLNTQDRWYGNGSDPSPQVDARQKILCENVKAAGITLYTVQVNTTGDPTSAMLKACASTPDKFFLLTSSSAMVTTFNQIGTALSNRRVAK